jgi:alpha-galactosidase
MLQRHSIQSTSDQEDYRHYATIAANSPTGVTPEQSAIWSYPLREGDKEEVVFNMVNAMLLRIHQSGHLAELSPERKELVKEALDYYKVIRQDIGNGLPFWPIGLSSFSDGWVSLGIRTEQKTYVAVWRRQGEDKNIILPIPHLKGETVSVKCAYPTYEECKYGWNQKPGTLSVRMDHQYSARLFEITREEKA